MYTWVDERGVVHMTDRKVEDPNKKITEIGDAPGPPLSSSGGRKGAIQAMVAAARKNQRFAELQEIAAEYRRTHSYSMADYFVCVDMAMEMYNILKTKQFSTKIVVGTIKTDIAGMEPAKVTKTLNHAWVVVELEPGVRLAIETTGGFVVDEHAQNFENYYHGLVCADPRQVKDINTLISNLNDNCNKANSLIKDWNTNYAGRAADARSAGTKGKVDAKVSECTDYQKQYEEIVKKQYRTLY